MPLLVASLAVVAAYLLGGIPTGLLLGRWLKGVDLREYGSGKTGATNAARTLGWRISALVFVVDILKGAGAVLITRLLVGQPVAESLAGIAAVAGHCWSPYIGFKGGRGVSTGIGGALAIAPLVVLLVIPVGLIVIVTTRYVSLASLWGTVSVPVGIGILALLGIVRPEYLVYGVGGAAIIVVMHRDNIQRLLAGTERKFGERATAAKSPAGTGSHIR